MYVFGHNCYVFHMDCAKVGVFQEPKQICLCSLLQGQNVMHLEVHVISTHFKGYLTD